MKRARRVCVVTAGHLSTCPRAVRIADALSEGGYAVRVVSARFLDWADAADIEIRRSRHWEWQTVDYRRDHARIAYLKSGLRWRGSQRATRWVGPDTAPSWLIRRAYGRVGPELLRAAASESADLYFGCSNGGLLPAADAARLERAPYALDLEDFHSAENAPDPEGALNDAMAERAEHALLPGAALLTAGSGAIASAYGAKYGRTPVALHNTLPLPAVCPDFTALPCGPLRLRWIGQTLGPGKRMRTVVRGIGISGVTAELSTRGRSEPNYARDLHQLAAAVAPKLELRILPPAPPDELPAFCRTGDIGVAPVHASTVNSRLALPNKAFTYMTAGLALALGRSEGHSDLASDVGDAVVFEPADPSALADGLRRWALQPGTLIEARRAAWRAASRRWNWDRDKESLLAAVSGVWTS
ncbi:MAG: hypothetical protein R2762_12405 [Bryobacteraceae bacterium]